MSVQSSAAHDFPLQPAPIPQEGRSLRILYWALALPTILVLLMAAVYDWAALRSSLGLLLVWMVMVVVTDLMAIPVWGTVVLTMSLPVLLAAGMVFPPYAAGLLAFLGCTDIREFKGEISLGRALYNRSQVALSTATGAIVFHALGGDLRNWPAVMAIGFGALAADFSVNSLLVGFPTRLLTGMGLFHAIRRMHGDSPLEHAAGYVCLGFLALVVGIAYEFAGAWGLAVCLSPLALAKLMFGSEKRLDRVVRAAEAKSRALATTMHRVVDERREERLVVAGGLHDDVLQPLYKVHLMGQVVRQDLDSGRLLDLDRDVPDLIDATDAAQRAIRSVIRDLRQSPIGSAGLRGTIELLMRDLREQTPAEFQLEVSEVIAPPDAQLVAYQVVREALQNVVKHAHASRVSVRVWEESDGLRVLIEDDGRGFDPYQVDTDAHFGLQLVSERVSAHGGQTAISSSLGAGTRVSAVLPFGGRAAGG